jgi:hypothetical protein
MLTIEGLTGFLAAPPVWPVMLAAAFAGVVRGYTGFGSAMVFMPVAAAALGPVKAIGVMIMIDAIMQFALVRGTWRQARWREIGPLFAGYCVGMPLGVYALVSLDPIVLRWATCLMIAGGLALLLSGLRTATSPGLPVTLAAGVTSGVVSGATSLGGLVLSLFWLMGPASNAGMRASQFAFFVLGSAVAITSFALAGVFTTEVLRLGLWCLAPYAAGIALGALIFAQASPTLFRPVAFVVIGLAVITSLPTLDGVIR